MDTTRGSAFNTRRGRGNGQRRGLIHLDNAPFGPHVEPIQTSDDGVVSRLLHLGNNAGYRPRILDFCGHGRSQLPLFIHKPEAWEHGASLCNKASAVAGQLHPTSHRHDGRTGACEHRVCVEGKHSTNASITGATWISGGSSNCIHRVKRLPLVQTDAQYRVLGVFWAPPCHTHQLGHCDHHFAWMLVDHALLQLRDPLLQGTLLLFENPGDETVGRFGTLCLARLNLFLQLLHGFQGSLPTQCALHYGRYWLGGSAARHVLLGIEDALKLDVWHKPCARLELHVSSEHGNGRAPSLWPRVWRQSLNVWRIMRLKVLP